jgi:hypothetical protein
VLDRGHFPAELVLVGLGRLVPHHLLLGLGMPALGQARERLRPDRPLKAPLLGELALPLTVALLLPAPVVRFLRRELAGVRRPRLATGERFGDRQHLRRILGLDVPTSHCAIWQEGLRRARTALRLFISFQVSMYRRSSKFLGLYATFDEPGRLILHEVSGWSS